ncbi:MAG: hypothetical protein ACFFEW_16340 [Candidatus Thorarchaeota archaeon]
MSRKSKPIRIIDEQSAYVDILSKLQNNPNLRNLIDDVKDVDYSSSAAVASVAGTNSILFNIESWWYLTFRTCNAAGAILVAKFAHSWQASYDGITLAELVSTFEIFVMGLGDWWGSGSAAVIAGGLSPWVPEDV